MTFEHDLQQTQCFLYSEQVIFMVNN